MLKWVTESRVELPASLVLGSAVEIPKKFYERYLEAKEKREEEEKAEAQPRAAQAPRKPASR